MTVVREFRTPSDYWLGMVEPDYQECIDNPADLRAAFHAAISLFHMHDWVWRTHEAVVRAAGFSFTNGIGQTIAVFDSASFANALEQQCADFGRVRGIANAAKHLELRPGNIRPVANAPSHAANTAVQTTGWGEAGWGRGPWGGGPRVMLAGPNGSDMEFSDVAKGTFEMWENLRTTHSW
jgi:hypothetical protein